MTVSVYMYAHFFTCKCIYLTKCIKWWKEKRYAVKKVQNRSSIILKNTTVALSPFCRTLPIGSELCNRTGPNLPTTQYTKLDLDSQGVQIKGNAL